MPFLYSTIFYVGLAAVAVPLLIHLLNRRRFQVRPWAAMKFLMESVRKNRRRLRIEELILLALRCLAVVLVGAVLARFTGCSAMNALSGGPGGGTTVFVLDDSYSMGQKAGAGALFAAATTDLAEQIEKLPSSQQAAILLSSGSGAAGPFFPRGYITEKKSLIDRIRSLEVSAARTQLADSLAAAAQVFKDVAGPKRLFLLGDFRHGDLAGPEQAKAIRKQYALLAGQGVGVVVMDYGRAARENLTIQDLRLVEKCAVAKAPCHVELTVRNNGSAAAANVQVRFNARYGAAGEGDMNSPPSAREVTLPVQVIESIDPGQSCPVRCPVMFTHPGAAAITAELPADELPGDNACHLAVDVREYTKVLVVDGQPDVTDPTLSESFFFVHAIDPRRDGAYGNRPEVISADAIGGAHFDDYDLVVLMNVPDFPVQMVDGKATYPALASLERYVRGGGGLAVFAGERINLGFYREAFYNHGSGLLPVRLGPRIGKGDPAGEYYRLDPKSLSSGEFLQTFVGPGAAFASLLRFFAFNSSEEAQAAQASEDLSPPRVLARFADPQNSPALVARQFGQGQVILATTTGSARWTDWPTDHFGTFVVAMNDMLGYLARAPKPLTDLVGQPILVDVPAGFADAPAALRCPAYPKEEEISLTPQRSPAGGLCLQYDRAAEAGIYSLTIHLAGSPPAEILVARNPDPAEGDLAPGGQKDLQMAFGSDDFVYQAHQSAGATGDLQGRVEKEYWTWMLGALIAVLAAETLLGQRFGHYGRSPTRGGAAQ